MLGTLLCWPYNPIFLTLSLLVFAYLNAILRDSWRVEHNNPSSQAWPVVDTLVLAYFVSSYRQLGKGCARGAGVILCFAINCPWRHLGQG